jgi:hypothetical protein
MNLSRLPPRRRCLRIGLRRLRRRFSSIGIWKLSGRLVCWSLELPYPRPRVALSLSIRGLSIWDNFNRYFFQRFAKKTIFYEPNPKPPLPRTFAPRSAARHTCLSQAAADTNAGDHPISQRNLAPIFLPFFRKVRNRQSAIH